MPYEHTLIKICGVTSPDDALLAIEAGADRIGFVLSGSLRAVTTGAAKEIAEAARELGALSVAVFVEESLEELLTIAEEVKMDKIQLHSEKTRAYAPNLEKNKIIEVMDVELSGKRQNNSLDKEQEVLFDAKGGGTGTPFDWTATARPDHPLLWVAGGLNPQNVGEAIKIFRPYGVDVASGVRKEPRKLCPSLVQQFCDEVKRVNTT